MRVSQINTDGESLLVRQLLEARHDCVNVVAVDAYGVPAECLPLVGDGFGAQHVHSGAVGLQSVHVNNRGQVVQAVVRANLSGLPGGAFVEFAVGKQVVHPASLPR